MPGQPNLPPWLTIDCAPVMQTDVGGIPSELIIDRTQGVVLKTNITLGGTFRGLFAGNNYDAKFFAEGLGTLSDVQLAAVPGVFGPVGPNPTVVPVSSPVLSGVALPADGLYKLTVVITVAGGPVAAFADGPVIQIITP